MTIGTTQAPPNIHFLKVMTNKLQTQNGVHAEGLYCCEVVKEELSFGHSYKNPIWTSDFHFYNMYPGHSHTDFTNRFSHDLMYREIFTRDVVSLQNKLDRLGTAYCCDDIEAYDETVQFIDFCKKWLQVPDVVVIYQSEL